MTTATPTGPLARDTTMTNTLPRRIDAQLALLERLQANPLAVTGVLDVTTEERTISSTLGQPVDMDEDRDALARFFGAA